MIAHYDVQPGNADKLCLLLAGLAEATTTEHRSTAVPQYRSTAHFQNIGFGQVIPLLARRDVSSHMVHNDG